VNDIVAGARFNLCLKCGKLFPIKDWDDLGAAMDGKLPPHHCPEKTVEEWKAEFARQAVEAETMPGPGRE
jgi:hypothetical protein